MHPLSPHLPIMGASHPVLLRGCCPHPRIHPYLPSVHPVCISNPLMCRGGGYHDVSGTYTHSDMCTCTYTHYLVHAVHTLIHLHTVPTAHTVVHAVLQCTPPVHVLVLGAVSNTTHQWYHWYPVSPHMGTSTHYGVIVATGYVQYSHYCTVCTRTAHCVQEGVLQGTLVHTTGSVCSTCTTIVAIYPVLGDIRDTWVICMHCHLACLVPANASVARHACTVSVQYTLTLPTQGAVCTQYRVQWPPMYLVVCTTVHSGSHYVPLHAHMGRYSAHIGHIRDLCAHSVGTTSTYSGYPCT